MNRFAHVWFAIAFVLTGVFVVSLLLATREPTPEAPIAPLPTEEGEASLTLLSPTSGTLEAGQTQTVLWESKSYTSPFIGINLIRKVGDTPARYELVRVIAEKTKNDGSAVWVPAPTTDLGEGLSIELVCVGVRKEACRAGNDGAPTSKIAVINTGRFANTASAYQAIERLNNK
ncbi:MAG: hypothetical protein A2849_03330 [Candidatus Taylorbacteria bacterium RIFCSPHIGHO2_01_FULL_51_15]|uniref:Uncharacterized protein n=1 Tax=Candidatus Taylorbacteria bacterium RIFCSPHIGHO2_01_FULL_51_15 TaxID=1802304 RepID=A0A1G2MC07_9BACT|nr:MAG: hypothetical protein A2849_03330 [Candidatus Taylorbacteria bacterium RIFCSPHIGHO2_01_FULL_51_15]